MSFSLRASVANICNMDCVYCPRWTSMEDYSPQGLDAPGLRHDDYVRVLTNLAQAIPLTTISLTGGEPLVNNRLHEIAAAVRPHTKRLELNTNGILLTRDRWRQLRPYFDRVKISMDSVDAGQFARITGLKSASSLQRVQDAIRMVRDDGVELAVNCVAMKSNMAQIPDVIAWARENHVRLHLLDFYYTKERCQKWQDEFVPLESIMPMLAEQYGKPQVDDVFGCLFLAFNFESGSSVLRIKTSYSGTMRSERCHRCTHFCQEGLYGIKLSQKGWVTSCPSDAPEDGVMVRPGWNVDETRQAIDWIVKDIGSARLMPDSFRVFIDRNHLKSPEVES